ncbi:MAG: four helix bundle protein [Candidatus Omnitrophica bacterium]|nr:four helix bundle protein [Candidatus Omnitrophota bacterium]
MNKTTEIKTYKDLEAHERAMNLAMEIFEQTQSFPREGQYSMTDQIRRSSRSIRLRREPRPWSGRNAKRMPSEALAKEGKLLRRIPPSGKVPRACPQGSIGANIGEAWRKRRYRAAFIRKLSGAETKTTETQVGIDIVPRWQYLPETKSAKLDDPCDHMMSQIVLRIDRAEKWLIRGAHHE